MEENEKNEVINNNENVIGVVEDKKKTSKIFVLVLTLIIIALVGYIGYDKLYANKNVNTNNDNINTNSGNVNNEVENSDVEVKKELDEKTKKEILTLIGLTENGLERMKDEDIIADGLPSGDYAYCYGNNLSSTFFGINAGTYKIDQLDIDIKKNIVRYGAQTLGLMDKFVIPEGEDVTCTAGSYCDAITEDNFNKVIKKYTISGNIKDYFDEYEWQKKDNYYLYMMSGYISIPCTISDSISYEVYDNKIEVIYDIKQEEVEDSMGYKLNKKITYTFRATNDSSYSLSQVKVEEK